MIYSIIWNRNIFSVSRDSLRFSTSTNVLVNAFKATSFSMRVHLSSSLLCPVQFRFKTKSSFSALASVLLLQSDPRDGSLLSPLPFCSISTPSPSGHFYGAAHRLPAICQGSCDRVFSIEAWRSLLSLWSTALYDLHSVGEICPWASRPCNDDVHELHMAGRRLYCPMRFENCDSCGKNHNLQCFRAFKREFVTLSEKLKRFRLPNQTY